MDRIDLIRPVGRDPIYNAANDINRFVNTSLLSPNEIRNILDLQPSDIAAEEEARNNCIKRGMTDDFEPLIDLDEITTVLCYAAIVYYAEGKSYDSEILAPGIQNGMLEQPMPSSMVNACPVQQEAENEAEEEDMKYWLEVKDNEISILDKELSEATRELKKAKGLLSKYKAGNKCSKDRDDLEAIQSIRDQIYSEAIDAKSERIAELQYQLAQAERIAELQNQLAQTGNDVEATIAEENQVVASIVYIISALTVACVVVVNWLSQPMETPLGEAIPTLAFALFLAFTACKEVSSVAKNRKKNP